MRICSSQVLEQWSVGGYCEYRIPGLVVTSAGTLLACFEARMADGNDWAGTDIILRRSTDGGQTFSRTILVQHISADTVTYNNPILISDGERIHFLWHRDYAQAFYQVSLDDGQTFSKPIEITTAFAEFRDRYDWTGIASGPGHGIALQNGRLVVPVWLAQGQPLDAAGRIRAHHPSVAATIYSDDHGASWHSGGLVTGLCDGNETTAVELSNGQVMLNIRHHEPSRHRAICLSTDGGGSFCPPSFDLALPDPICFGSLVRAPGCGIFFVNCAHNRDRRRIDLTLRLSQDDGRNWPSQILVDPVGGYADIAWMANQSIYCLYERTVARDGRNVIDQLILARIDVTD